MVLPGELKFAAEALHTPQVGGQCGGMVLSWFPDGFYGKGTWGTQTPQRGTDWCQKASGFSLSPVSVTGLVSVTHSPYCPSCPRVSPGWVGVGAGDLSLAACLPSETLGVGADAAVSYGPPTPMLLLCLGSGCEPPPPKCLVWGAPTPFPGHPPCDGLKQISPVSRLLQAIEDSWKTPLLSWSPGWPRDVGASFSESLRFPLIEIAGVQRRLSSAPPPPNAHSGGQ